MQLIQTTRYKMQKLKQATQLYKSGGRNNFEKKRNTIEVI